MTPKKKEIIEAQFDEWWGGSRRCADCRPPKRNY